MGESTKIIRSSINTFFYGYHTFMSVTILLVLPFSASILLSQALVSSSPSSLHFISLRFCSLFQASSFPVNSQPFTIFNNMLSQTLFSLIFTLPFTLTFLTLAKASIADITREYPSCKRTQLSFSSLAFFFPILTTHIFNLCLILSINATIFACVFLVFNSLTFIGFSTNSMYYVSIILYSIAIANSIVICNMAIIVSAMEKCDGYVSVLIKAWNLIRGKFAVAIQIALPCNLGMIAAEALFQYRVMRVYNASKSLNFTMFSEAFTIAYIHSVMVAIEIITGCLFYKCCKSEFRVEYEPEEKGQV